MTPSDPTPFQTRTNLLALYGDQVRGVRQGPDPYPVTLEVNASNSCDQGCHWCISENVQQQRSLLDFSHPAVRQFFVDFAAHGGRAVGWSGGGEPTRHPQFAEGLQLVAATGLEQGLITHGGFAPRLADAIAAHCRWVRISIDTCDRDAYAEKRRVTPVTFDHVVANVQRLVERGARVGLNMNVAQWNLTHIEELYELACALRVDYLQVRPTLPTPFPHAMTEELLSRESVDAILRRLEDLRIARPEGVRLVVSHDKFEDVVLPDFGRTYQGCRSHRLFVVLNWDGDLMVCMYHLADKRFCFGNVYEQSLEQIWQSSQRREVMRFCDEELNHLVHGCQACCKGHEINKVLFDLVEAPAPVEPPRSPFL